MGMDDGAGNGTIEVDDEARQDADIARLFTPEARNDALSFAPSPDTDATVAPLEARKPTAAKRPENYKLTLPEVAALFHQAGIPRSRRTLQRYCLTEGLEAYFDLDERIYYVTAESVSDLISHIKEVNMRHAAATIFGQPPPLTRNDAPPFAPSPDTSAPKAEELRDNKKHGATEERITQLEEENFQLKIDAAARAQVITELRQVIRDDRTFYTKHVSKLSMLASSFKSRLLQLGAPREELDAAEDAETSELDDSALSRAFKEDLNG